MQESGIATISISSAHVGSYSSAPHPSTHTAFVQAGMTEAFLVGRNKLSSSRLRGILRIRDIQGAALADPGEHDRGTLRIRAADHRGHHFGAGRTAIEQYLVKALASVKYSKLPYLGLRYRDS
jgi:hypothetical protein